MTKRQNRNIIFMYLLPVRYAVKTTGGVGNQKNFAVKIYLLTVLWHILGVGACLYLFDCPSSRILIHLRSVATRYK